MSRVQQRFHHHSSSANEQQRTTAAAPGPDHWGRASTDLGQLDGQSGRRKVNTGGDGHRHQPPVQSEMSDSHSNDNKEEKKEKKKKKNNNGPNSINVHPLHARIPKLIQTLLVCKAMSIHMFDSSVMIGRARREMSRYFVDEAWWLFGLLSAY